MTTSQGTWNYTLDDTSPVFRYKPYSDGIGLSKGWQAWYSTSGFLSTPGEGPGQGNSYHVTSLQSASVQLSFFGTGISLFGIANCTYDVVLDGTQKANGSPPFNTLFSEYKFDNGPHNITLIAQPSAENQTLQFDGAQITSLAPDAQSGSPSTIRIDNQNTSMISYQGDWTPRNDAKVPTTESPSPYFQTNSSGASASMNFTGRAVEIRGISNYGWWQYLVTLDGKDISGMNASSWWIIPDAVLFYQDGLDENSTHSLSITNSAGNGVDLALNSVTVYHFDKSSSSTPTSPSSSSLSHSVSPESSKGLSGGQTAGIVVGAFTGAALVAFAIFLFCFRRLRSPSKTGSRPTSLLSSYTKFYSASDSQSQSPSVTELTHSSPSQGSTLIPPSSFPSTIERSDSQRQMVFGESLFASTDAVSSYPRSPTMPSEYMPTLTPRNVPRATSGILPRFNLVADRKGTLRGPNAQPAVTASQAAAVEHIADAVAERLAVRLGPSDLEAPSPPPCYNRF